MFYSLSVNDIEGPEFLHSIPDVVKIEQSSHFLGIESVEKAKKLKELILICLMILRYIF